MISLLYRKSFQDASIRRKLVTLMIVAAVSGPIIAAPIWAFYAWTSARSAAVRDLQTTTRVIADNVSAALTFGDTKASGEVLSALRAKTEVVSACLYRDDHGSDQLFATYSIEQMPCSPHAGALPESNFDLLIVESAVTLANEKIGMLRVTQSLKGLHEVLSKQIAVILLVLAAASVASIAIGQRMHRAITGPIFRLTEATRRVSLTKDYSQRVPESGRDELGQLSADFNDMLSQIEKADAEIRSGRAALAAEIEMKSKANAELEHALDILRRTQAQLVQSEKMASLGALVAGVAHEINTPVGIGVTAASTLQARAAQIRQKYEKDGLTRSELERFLTTANESGEIILNNLQRAADLIQSFKRVAVDQSSNERRLFNLRIYIGEVLQSLAPKLKTAGHVVTVDCPQGIELDSYPGVLAQILTNFISNSLLHAFGHGQKGHITISASLADDIVILRCADDGVGVPAEVLARIFDPFFTTKRGSGGTGLGLHIVFNLVTKTLGGTISADSAPGQGLAITIRLPRVAIENKP